MPTDDKVYGKKTARGVKKLKTLDKKIDGLLKRYRKPMCKRKIDKKLKQHNKFLATGKGKPADFSNALLYYADLSGANLWGACFKGATLQAVKFKGADLGSADFAGARFIVTDLSDANLRGAYLKGVIADTIFTNKNTEMFVPLNCPSSGSFIGWKKALYKDETKVCIVKLLIPEDAKRSSAFSEKCRCSKAVILDAYDTATKCSLGRSTLIQSIHDPAFAYHIGDTITIPDFDDNRWDECSSGFHFFVDEESAKNF